MFERKAAALFKIKFPKEVCLEVTFYASTGTVNEKQVFLVYQELMLSDLLSFRKKLYESTLKYTTIRIALSMMKENFTN